MAEMQSDKEKRSRSCKLVSCLRYLDFTLKANTIREGFQTGVNSQVCTFQNYSSCSLEVWEEKEKTWESQLL